MEPDGQMPFDEDEVVQAAPASQKAPLVAAGRGAVGLAKGNGTARSLQRPSKKPPLLAAGGSAVGSARGPGTARRIAAPREAAAGRCRRRPALLFEEGAAAFPVLRHLPDGEAPGTAVVPSAEATVWGFIIC